MRFFWSFLTLTAIFCFLVPFASLAQAQGHQAFCGKADSTAASQQCLKRHLDSAQKRLNKVYQNLSSNLTPEKLGELKELQKTWLAYRDAECMWEAKSSETLSLKRMNEISCMARVTEDRADLLTIAYGEGDIKGVQREYGSFPRWMNALAKDNTGVFWDYDARTAVDLNCDDEDEYIMQGVVTTPIKKSAEDVQNITFTQQQIIAVVQNPTTGRPQSDIFKFSVTGADGKDTFCSDKVSLNVSEGAEQSSTKESEKEKTCATVLTLSQKGCQDKVISWAGKNFTLHVEKDAE